MGKTYKDRKEKSQKTKTRIRPYTKDGIAGKFVLEPTQSQSFENKEIYRNANRALKKGLRQKYKLEIKNLLQIEEDTPS